LKLANAQRTKLLRASNDDGYVVPVELQHESVDLPTKVPELVAVITPEAVGRGAIIDRLGLSSKRVR
jgi:hypothetical protein